MKSTTTLRGSKLDAQVKREFEAALENAWDTSAWPRWTVSGRILPERCDVNFPSRTVRAVGPGGKMEVSYVVVRSHIMAVCAFENDGPSIFQIADLVRNVLAFPIDYCAFQNRAAYEIILDLCMSNQSGEVSPIPVYEPTFEPPEAGLCFSTEPAKSTFEIPYQAGRSPALQAALHDLTQAVRYPRRTFEYCRMAMEAVRQHFDPPTKKRAKEKWIAGEKEMSAVLGVTRDSLKALEATAARSRHGELSFSMNWKRRKVALEFAWEVVARFAAHLQDAPLDRLKLLDTRFTDGD